VLLDCTHCHLTVYRQASLVPARPCPRCASPLRARPGLRSRPEFERALDRAVGERFRRTTGRGER
jgi:hypothetical protein